ncbi:DUF4468 domain-containing protein [Spirosoma pomorum]
MFNFTKTVTFCLLGMTFLVLDKSIAQDLPIDPETQLITYSEVVEVPSVSKGELFNRANTWLTRAFKGSTKQVIEMEDKESGKVVGRGLIPTQVKIPITGMTDAGFVSATFTIICKDGKYKYVVDNLTHEKPDKQNWSSAGALEQKKPKNDKLLMRSPSPYEWRAIKEATDENIKKMVAGMKKALQTTEADF